MTDNNGVTKKPAAKRTAQKKKVTSAVDVPEKTTLSSVAAPAKTLATNTIAVTADTVKKPTIKKTTAKNSVSLQQIATISTDIRQKMIEDAAYFKAEKRNFAPGHEVQDWADAEREIDDLINRAKMMTGN
jgi:hypothetical protein